MNTIILSPHRSKKDSPRPSDRTSSRNSPRSSSRGGKESKDSKESRKKEEEIDPKSARQKRQALREQKQKEDETKKTDYSKPKSPRSNSFLMEPNATRSDSPDLKYDNMELTDRLSDDESGKPSQSYNCEDAGPSDSTIKSKFDDSQVAETLIPFDEQNGDAKSTDDDDIPDLEECPLERGISPAADTTEKRLQSTPTKSDTPTPEEKSKVEPEQKPEVLEFVATGDSGTVLHDDIESPKRTVKKLSELAAKKTDLVEPPEPVDESQQQIDTAKVESNPLDTVPKPETKSTKPGAKIEEIFAKLDEKKLEEASKLKPPSPKELPTPMITSWESDDRLQFSTNKLDVKPKEVASTTVEQEAASIMTSMQQTSMAKKTTTAQKTPSDAILSKLIGKQISSKVDDNALQFDDEMVDESERIVGSDLALPFDSVVGPEMVVGSEVR